MENAIIGCLLGTAVGDAFGLPMEGLSKRRQHRMYPEIKGYHFIFGKGMVSDDTEHTCMVARSIALSGGDEGRFARDLAWRLRLWLLGLPAGVGFATLRAIIKLWLGFSSEKSGVFSAGNGPAMRSAIIGVCFGEQRDKLKNLVKISTRITHTDPKAEYGALAVALAAYMASRHEKSPHGYLKALEENLGSGAEELLVLVEKAAASATGGHPTETFLSELGLDKGVSGYVYHTVPVVLHAWFCHPGDYRLAVVDAVRCGGDTDTVAAILGGIVGAAVGKEGIPKDMIANLWEWPITPKRMESLGKIVGNMVSEHKAQKVPGIPFWGLLLRNIFFTSVVLTHGFRRLLPPY